MRTIFVIFLTFASLAYAQDGPENLAFVGAAGTDITISFTGIETVEKYEVSLIALYDDSDRHGWIITLSGGPTTATITIDQITGLRRNILYTVRVAGIFGSDTGNYSEIIARTAAAGPVLTEAQIQPTLIVLYVSETPGATLCEVGYAKRADPSSEIFVQSDKVCKVVILRSLEANTEYSIRTRVIAAGGKSYPDNDFGDPLNITTAKLSLFARVEKIESYSSELADQSSATYVAKASEARVALFNLYRAEQSDVTDITILAFDRNDENGNTYIHHEIKTALTALPASTAAYTFTDAVYTIPVVTSQVRPNSYSLVDSNSAYTLKYENPPSACAWADKRALIISDSITKSQQTVALGELSEDRVANPDTEFQISGSRLTLDGGGQLYSFSNNSASVLTQQYLLKSCSSPSSELLFTQYHAAAHTTTTAGLEDAFVHETDFFSFPPTTSTGINKGNGTKITFDRVPNAISYQFGSGEGNVTLDATGIDSSDQFFVRLEPVTPSSRADADMQVVTKPYAEPKMKSTPIQVSTLPQDAQNVRWPYRDRNNLTLAWDEDEGVLGYYIIVRSERDSSAILQEFESEKPEAVVGGLDPGQFYYVKPVPYNYAGNASNENIGFRLFTDPDPPILSPTPLNVSHDYITIEWTGGNESIQVVTATSTGRNFTFDANVESPYTMTGLDPDTEYNVSVTATFDTGVTRSQFVLFKTDPAPTTTAASTTVPSETSAGTSAGTTATTNPSDTTPSVTTQPSTAASTEAITSRGASTVQEQTTAAQGTTQGASTVQEQTTATQSTTQGASTVQEQTTATQSTTPGHTTPALTSTLVTGTTHQPAPTDTSAEVHISSTHVSQSTSGSSDIHISTVQVHTSTHRPSDAQISTTQVSASTDNSEIQSSTAQAKNPLAPVISPVLLEQNDTSIKFEWQGSPGALSYTVKVVKPSGTLTVGNVTSPYLLRNLYPETEYTVTVEAKFSDASVDSKPEVFRTGPPTETPVLKEAVLEVDDQSLKIEWAGAVGAVSVTVGVKSPDGLSFTIKNAKSPLTISGLAPDTEYSVSITAQHDDKNVTGLTMTYRTGPLVTTADTQTTQQAEDDGLEWWVWLLVAVGAVAVLALAAVIIRAIVLAQSGAAPPAENTIGVIKWMFGKNQKYVISKGTLGQQAVLRSEKFNNTD